MLLRMVRILSVLMWGLNKGLRLVRKTALFDIDSYTIKGGILQGKRTLYGTQNGTQLSFEHIINY